MIVHVAAEEQGSTLIISFQNTTMNPPFRIQNMSRIPFQIRQTGTRKEDSLPPYQSIPFAWSCPKEEKAIDIHLMLE